MKVPPAWPWLALAGGSGLLLVVLTTSVLKQPAGKQALPTTVEESAPQGASFAPGFGRLDDLVPYAGGIAPVAEAVVANEHVSGFRSGDWVAAQNPQAWTLQVMAAREEEAVKRFLAEREDRADFAYFIFPQGGVNWYVVALGSFPTRELAEGVAESKGLLTGQGQAFPRRMAVYQEALLHPAPAPVQAPAPDGASTPAPEPAAPVQP